MSLEVLQGHLKKHSCQECGKAFQYKCKLARHRLMHLDISVPHRLRCKICYKISGCPSTLQDHMSMHAGKKPFMCSICGDRFRIEAVLKEHYVVHDNTRNFHCKPCEKSFKSLQCLQHHKRSHADRKVSKICHVCGKVIAARDPGQMNQHLRTHDIKETWSNFICQICKKTFRMKKTLEVHMRVHTGEKPYRCEQCGKCFSQPFPLKRHMRIHTGERAFKCSLCSRTFNQDTSLARHVRIHTGEKPYKCDVCGMSYRQSTPLTKHMKIHMEQNVKSTVCAS